VRIADARHTIREHAMAETAEKTTTSLKLRVAGARGDDVGKATVRLGSDAFSRLGIAEGDVVEIRGKRTTAALALPAYPEDEGLDVIRLDGLQRANAGVGMGDTVEVRRGEARVAKRVQLAPAQKNLMLRGSGEALKRTIYGRPLVVGDVISTSVYRRPIRTADRYPEDVYRDFFQQHAYGLQEIRLIVASVSPRGAVRIGRQPSVSAMLSSSIRVSAPNLAQPGGGSNGG